MSGQNEADILIIGAGAAGSVLASRLSEDGDRKVVLIEAGDDLVPGREPADIRSIFPLAAFNRRYMWPDTMVHWRRANNSPAVPLPQGRILGGSSAIMGMWAIRGVPADYDSWEADGAAGWAWRDVLPYFRKLETDADFDGPMHGRQGPIPIRREPEGAWSPLAHAIREETLRQGLPQIEDLNGDFRDGHCVMPNSRFPTSRGSSGICYLPEAVRHRRNLSVETDATVTSILFEGRRAVGVEVRGQDGSSRKILAREVVVAAGALRTPGLLLRAGIGDAAHLRDQGVEVLAHRPGVGKNLQNHPVLYICALLNPAGRESAAVRPAAATYLRWSSGIAGAPDADMSLYIRSYLAWHALGRRMASLAPSLQRPLSRGQVTLSGGARERIEFGLLEHERDMQRMKLGFALATRYFDAEATRRISGAPFVLTDAAKLMRFNDVTRWNALRSSAAALLTDLNEGLGLRIIKRFANLRGASDLVSDDAALEEYIRTAISGTGHVCGTCRMGDPEDLLAVCDSEGRVLGVEGLRVGDASLMPSVPSGNTHIPTVMVAEKIADAIRGVGGSRAAQSSSDPAIEGATS